MAATHVTDGAAASNGFRSLLVCLDRSEAAEAALPLAAYLARADGARLTLLHVLEPPPENGALRATDALEWEITRQEARCYVERLAEHALVEGVQAEVRIAEGSAAHSVAAAAAQLAADLVVLSRFGEGGADAWNLGGTAQKILALASGAVLIVPPSGRQPAARVPPRRLLVPLDGSLRGESVLPTVLHLARAADAEIVLCHAVPDPIRTEVLQTPEDLALARELTDRLVARAEAYLERIQNQLIGAGARARTAVSRTADHREGLVALVSGEAADLVVLSAHGSVCNPRRRFGTVTSYVVAHASAPVLVLQDLPERIGRPAAAPESRLPPRSLDAPGEA